MTERRDRGSSLPWYVPIGVAAFVVNAWAAAAVSPFAAMRTLVVAVLVASGLVAVIALVWGRQWQRAGLLVAAIALAMSGVHADVLTVGGRIPGWPGVMWIGAVTG